MAQLSRAVASLRVMGDDLVPDEVTALLGAPPSMAHVRGEQIPSKRGASRFASSGFWSFDAAETEPADINAQVARLLQGLTPDLDVWARLTTRFRVDLFCGWFMEHLNEGIQLSPATLTALGQRGIELDLDLYGADTEA